MSRSQWIAAAIFALLAVLPFAVAASTPRVETVRATRFAYDGDRWAGGVSPCLKRRVLPTDHVIAHRTLPCGARVRVTNLRTGLSTIAIVADRGPYGACRPGTWGKTCDWFVKRRASEPGTWRGGADLAPPVVAALQHRSFDRVRLEPLP